MFTILFMLYFYAIDYKGEGFIATLIFMTFVDFILALIAIRIAFPIAG